MRKGTVAHALPNHVPDLVTKAIQSEMKDKIDADTERNILKSHILTKRDKFAVNGISSSSANPRRSPERWRRLALLCSGDVEPYPLWARSHKRELLTADITAGTVAKFRRAFDACDFYHVVTHAVCYLHMDFSSLSKLSRPEMDFLDLTNLFFSEVPRTLVIALRRVALCASFLGAAVEIHILMFSSRHSFLVSWTVFSNLVWMQLRTTPRPASMGAVTAGVPHPFDYQTSCITTVATRAATVKYRSTSTSIAIS